MEDGGGSAQQQRISVVPEFRRSTTDKQAARRLSAARQNSTNSPQLLVADAGHIDAHISDLQEGEQGEVEIVQWPDISFRKATIFPDTPLMSEAETSGDIFAARWQRAWWRRALRAS